MKDIQIHWHEADSHEARNPALPNQLPDAVMQNIVQGEAALADEDG